MSQDLQSPNEMQMSFEEAMALALGREPVKSEPAEVPSEAPAVEPEAAAPNSAGSVDPAKVAVVEPALKASPPATEGAKPAEGEDSTSMKALMAREAAAVAKETALREAETDIRELRSRVETYERDKAAFAVNRVAYIRSLAPDVPLSTIAEELWFEDLGEAAPKEYQLRKEVRGTKAELHEMRTKQSEDAKRQAEEKSRMEAETALNQYVGQLKEAIPQLDASKNRLVKSLAAQNADMAIRMMLDAASYAAQEGKVLTPAEAAEAVEHYLSQFAPLYAPAPSPESPASPPEPNAKSVPSSLRNSSVSVQTPRVPPDPNDPRVLRRNALKEAGLDPDDPSFRSWLEE